MLINIIRPNQPVKPFLIFLWGKPIPIGKQGAMAKTVSGTGKWKTFLMVFTIDQPGERSPLVQKEIFPLCRGDAQGSLSSDLQTIDQDSGISFQDSG
jgi:hypothetical protein